MEYGLVLAWTLAIVVLAVLGAPLARAVFARFPTDGGGLSVHLALLGIGLTSFWIGHLSYGLTALVAAFVLLGVISGALYNSGYRPDWRSVAEGTLAVILGFYGALVFRATSPSLTPLGGEQFLHYGLLNAVDRASTLPPEDMWFAGEGVNYYYGGHVLVDQLSTLTGTAPRFAYNLGLALFFGLAAGAAYELVGAMAAHRGRSRRAGGALGAGLLLLGGTLATPIRLIIGLLPTDIAVEYGAFAFEAIRSTDPIAQVIADQGSFDTWFWWEARYVVDGTLQEVPLYSLVKADLHGHVTTIPFMVAIAAVGYAYYRTPTEQRWRRRGLALGVLPAIAGLVGWMNTWSLPGAAGIAWLAVTFAPAHPLTLLPRSFDSRWEPIRDTHRLGRELVRTGSGAAVGAIVGLLGATWVAPFVLFQLPTNGGIGFFPSRSPLGQQLLVWGGFFAIFALIIGLRVWQESDPTERPRRPLFVLGGSGLVIIGLSVLGFGSVAVGGGILALAWYLLRRNVTALGYAGVLLVGGVGLVLAMEVVYAEVWPPDLDRWNTTYKVSMQAFVLCALAAAAIFTDLIGEGLTRLRRTGRIRQAGIVIVCVVLLLAMAVFPVMILSHEFGDYVTGDADVDPTLDGLELQETFYQDRLAAIQWLNDRDGTPTILEAPGEGPYQWRNVGSTFTGLPTVAGWSHEQGYRGVDVYQSRVEDADAMYTGDRERALALLSKYTVEYIWVGPVEQERYGTSLRDFAAIDGISVAYDAGGYTIYAVTDAMPASSG